MNHQNMHRVENNRDIHTCIVSHMASLPPQVVIQERPKKHYFPKEFEN
jgi:hypothetical protein